MAKITIKKPSIKIPKLRIGLNFLPTKVQNVLSNKELRNKILFTILIIVIIRALNIVPIQASQKKS